jgi:hypothetical protein
MIGELLSAIFLPMLLLCFSQVFFVRLLCRIFFIEHGSLLSLRNHRVYYAYSYVSFFLDCFLGSLLCLGRLGGALVCSLIFSSRLDYSPCGRAVEKHDISYMSYVSYLHMDLHRRHPVVNVFIDMIRQRLIDVRKSNLTSSLTTDDQRREMKRLVQLARFRWALAYTLINNGTLRNSRKHRFISTPEC